MNDKKKKEEKEESGGWFAAKKEKRKVQRSAPPPASSPTKTKQEEGVFGIKLPDLGRMCSLTLECLASRLLISVPEPKH